MTDYLKEHFEDMKSKRANLELEVISFIQKSEEGLVFLEEIKPGYFWIKDNLEYVTLLRNLHKTKLPENELNKKMLMIQTTASLLTPEHEKAWYLNKLETYYFYHKTYLALQNAADMMINMRPEESKKHLDSTQENLFRLQNRDLKTKIVSMTDHTVEEILADEKICPLGWESLEDIFYRPQSLIVLAARPGHGKTTFAINMALKAFQNIAFFSYEIGIKRLKEIMIRANFDLTLEELKSRERDLEITDWMHEIREQIKFVEASPLNIEKLKASIKFLVRSHGVKIIYIDYLGIVPPSKKFEKRYLEIAYCVRQLKLLAVELEVAIVVIAQLSRGFEKEKKGCMPVLADIKESGAIEENADLILFLYSTSSVQADSDKPHELKVKVSKNRHGPLLLKNLHYNKTTGAINDWQNEY